MATDRRELILSRLLDIFKGLDGVELAVRNRTLVDGDDLPGMFLMDADESALIAQGAARVPDGKPIGLSDLCAMTPEIYLQLPVVKPHNQLVGPEINEWRRKIVAAVLSDASLKAYVSEPQGTIRYLEFRTAFGRNRTNDGICQVLFQFIYPHIISELS